METLVSGIALAIISGLTFLAYKHPNAYRKMHTPLVAALCLVTIGGMIWFSAVSYTFETMMEFTPLDKFEEASQKIDSIRPPMWGVWASLVIFFFLAFLSSLPDILGKQEPPSPKNGEEHD